MKKILSINCLAVLWCMPICAEHNDEHVTDSIQDNIRFWSHQQSEHAEFCRDFAHDPTLKREGDRLKAAFKQIEKNPENRKEEFLKATADEKKFQKKVYKDLRRDDADYQIKKDLIDHMNKEANYAEKKVKGKKFSPKDEAKFWMEEHEGEAKTMAYYMNDNGKLKADATEVAQDLRRGGKDTDQVAEALEANAELNIIANALEKQPEKTSMPEKLAHHEKRERERAAKLLQKFN